MFVPRLNITQKFIGYLIFLSIFPLLIVGVVSYQISANILKDEASRYTMELVINQRDYLDLQLEQVESLISNLSGVAEIREVLDNENVGSDTYTSLTTHARIGYILSGYSNLRGLLSIDIFTANGVHYHVGDTLNTENIRINIQESIFAEALNSEQQVVWIGIEDNVNANSTHQKVVIAAKVLYQVNRDTLQQIPTALFLVNYSVETLYEHFSRVDLGENAYMMLVDDKGRIIYHPDRTTLGEQVNSGLAQIVSSENGSITQTIDNIDMSISIVRSDVSNWTIISLIPLDTLTAKAVPIQNAMMIMLLVCFVAVTIIGWFYNLSVVTPIRQITQQFKLIQEERLDLQSGHVPVHGNDEITDLGHWFNTFIDVLANRQQEEQTLRASLITTQTLYRTSQSLIALKELPDLLQVVVDDLVIALSADRATLISIDLEAKQISQFVKSKQGSHNIIRVDFDELQSGLTGWVLREGEPALSPKGIPDPRESPEVQQRRIKTACGDIIVVPLHYRGEIQGTMTAINRPEQADFTQQDVELMVALANQAAIAIENARLVYSLRASEEKFFKAFHASPDPMLISSLTGKRFMDVNESFLDIIGYARDKIIGSKTTEINIWLNPEDRIQFMELLQKQGAVRNFEAAFQKKSGEVGSRLISSEIIELNNEQCILTVFKDITERKKNEEQRVALAMERERVQILADFITEASHEFKTPLSIIKTSSYLLGKNLNPAKQSQIIRTIGDQVEVVTALVESLTLMTKLDSGSQNFMFVEVNLNEILRNIYYELQSILKDGKFECVFELSKNPLLVYGDAAYLKHAIWNIWDNAIKYTPPEGSITVRISSKDGKAIIEISDTGSGISNDDLDHIFERFYQVDKAGTLRGFGLGLAIAKTIIDLHQGHIDVKSSGLQGQGAIFRVLLPIHGDSISDVVTDN